MHAFCGDVSKADEVQKFVRSVVAKFGRIDYVINIVGVKRMGNIETCSLDDLDFVLNGSVRSTFIVSKTCVPHLIETKGRHDVNLFCHNWSYHNLFISLYRGCQ